MRTTIESPNLTRMKLWVISGSRSRLRDRKLLSLCSLTFILYSFIFTFLCLNFHLALGGSGPGPVFTVYVMGILVALTWTGSLYSC